MEVLDSSDYHYLVTPLRAIAFSIAVVILSLEMGVLLYLQTISFFGQIRDIWRLYDVFTIRNAVFDYTLEHGGLTPTSIDDEEFTVQVIGLDRFCTSQCGTHRTAQECINLYSDVGQYMPVHLSDPLTGSLYNTNYYVNKDARGRVTVGACTPEVDYDIESSNCIFQFAHRCKY